MIIRNTKQSRRIFKTWEFGQKSVHKIRAKKAVIVEEITTTKERLSTLHRDSREDVFRSSQEPVRLHLSQTQGCKNENSFKRT